MLPFGQGPPQKILIGTKPVMRIALGTGYRWNETA